MHNDKEGKSSISVVVCTHNRPKSLERCLIALRRSDIWDVSVIVVDSAPKSTEAKSIAARYDAQYVLSEKKGLSRARNVGTRVSKADIIAYLDDDMVPHQRWLSGLLSEFADERLALITGPVLSIEFVNGSDIDLLLALKLSPVGSHKFQIDRFSRHWVERTNFGGVGDGNFALRRSAFDKMGGFEERLGRGALIDSGEEHYAFFRLVESGLKILHTPSAVVFHPDSASSKVVMEKNVSDTVAYTAFVLRNHPCQGWRIAKFLLEGSVGVQRWWHPTFERPAVSLSMIEKIRSGLNGVAIFAKCLRKRSVSRSAYPSEERLPV